MAARSNLVSLAVSVIVVGMVPSPSGVKVCKVFKPEDMSLDLLVKSAWFKCEGPAHGRAYFADLRLSGVSRIWLWEKASLVFEMSSFVFGLLDDGGGEVSHRRGKTNGEEEEAGWFACLRVFPYEHCDAADWICVFQQS